MTKCRVMSVAVYWTGFLLVQPICADMWPPSESVPAFVYHQLQDYVEGVVAGFSGSQLKISPLHPLDWQQLPACDTEPDLRFSALNHTGKLMLSVRCQTSGELEKHGWKRRLSAKVDFLMPVFMTSSAVRKGQPLTSVERVNRPFSAIGQQTPAHQIDLKGAVATRPLKAKAVITTDVIKQPIVVHRGSEVAIVARSGAVVVTTSGTVMGSGKVGDVVSVKKDNGRVIACEVGSASEVFPISLRPISLRQSTMVAE